MLMEERFASANVCAQVRDSFDRMARFVRDFAPDQIVQFSPDHFHGFHYDLMPSFCVGAAATSYGDWGTEKGSLNVDEDFALALLDAVRDADVDAAVSFDMTVDHGFVQMWEAMFGRFDDLPIVPIFVNAIGYPLPKYHRARALGVAVGRFLATSGKRVLLAASGGLSHDPVVPRIVGAPADLRARLLGRFTFDPEQQARREEQVREAAGQAIIGAGPCRPLNPDWDRRFLHSLRNGDWAAIDALTPETVDAEAGAGANEALSWVAAAAALAAAGGAFEIVQEDYIAIPGWIAGMAHLAALPLR